MYIYDMETHELVAKSNSKGNLLFIFLPFFIFINKAIQEVSNFNWGWMNPKNLNYWAEYIQPIILIFLILIIFYVFITLLMNVIRMTSGYEYKLTKYSLEIRNLGKSTTYNWSDFSDFRSKNYLLNKSLILVTKKKVFLDVPDQIALNLNQNDFEIVEEYIRKLITPDISPVGKPYRIRFILGAAICLLAALTLMVITIRHQNQEREKMITEFNSNWGSKR